MVDVLGPGMQVVVWVEVGGNWLTLTWCEKIPENADVKWPDATRLQDR